VFVELRIDNIAAGTLMIGTPLHGVNYAVFSGRSRRRIQYIIIIIIIITIIHHAVAASFIDKVTFVLRLKLITYDDLQLQSESVAPSVAASRISVLCGFIAILTD